MYMVPRMLQSWTPNKSSSLRILSHNNILQTSPLIVSHRILFAELNDRSTTDLISGLYTVVNLPT